MSPLDNERMALAIHRSNEHPNMEGCLEMDRATAQALIYEYGSEPARTPIAEEKALATGTHIQAVDDFGNPYMEREPGL